jgi:hypothetical protein
LELNQTGHSFGGILVPKLANLCEQLGYPVRKVVMLAPGGPLIRINRAVTVDLIKDPEKSVKKLAPSWVPSAPLVAAANLTLSTLFSPNNVNSHFGFHQGWQ